MTGTLDAASAALSQIGLPYSWGAEDANVKFDCSGLTQWAYSQAGITIPRTSEAQYNAVTHITQSAAQPGDLVFSEFGTQGQAGPGHVGIYLGQGEYIDAPYTGANVQVNSIPTGAVFGTTRAGAVASTANPTGTVGQILNDIPGYSAVASSVDTTGSLIDTTGSLISDALHPSQLLAFWQRLGMALLGATLFGVGLAVYLSGTDTGQKTAGQATNVAAVAALA